jgi:hypothetical protein
MLNVASSNKDVKILFVVVLFAFVLYLWNAERGLRRRFTYYYELFCRGHGPSKLRSMLLVMVICNLV